jgi:aspartate aminotransferase-like enzyme
MLRRRRARAFLKPDRPRRVPLVMIPGMERYTLGLVPGPTRVPDQVLRAYTVDYGSADLEDEFFALYARVQGDLQHILQTRGDIAIMSGEGMLGLWAGLKSCLRPGDRVLAVGSGLFGEGIGDMARSIGADVETLHFAHDEPADPDDVIAAIRRVRPAMVTMVHCETPSGTLNSIADVGREAREHDALFYVDAVSSAAGAELCTDDWAIDVCLVGSQKCLSAPAGLSIVGVSERAWETIERTGYQGYDALQPWRRALEERYFPYTPYWHAVAALEVACRRVLDEGLSAGVGRHTRVAARCREGLRKLDLELFPKHEASSSPTVTAVRVPAGLEWPELDRRFRRRGLAVGGSYGEEAGSVFRLGHMGTQADESLVDRALDVIADALRAP